MMASTDYCLLPGNYGYKWPKLDELYLKLFRTPLINAHDAEVDIEATFKSYWKLRELGIIN
jgi:hypothetical protein